MPNIKQITAHIRSIPGFALKRERSVWFAVSVLALTWGLWLAVTWLRFLSDPTAYDLEPDSVIQYGWLIGAIGFGGGGLMGLYLGRNRWINTTTS